MRNILSLLLVWLGCICCVFADDLTPEQMNFRSNIIQFLKEEGFSPTIDEDDNSVMFKKEGHLHWIAIRDKNPFYIEFFRSGLNCKDADRNAVLAAVNVGNKDVRCAKAIMKEASITLVIEMYCHSPEEFRYVFYRSMGELQSLEKKVSESYNENNVSVSSSNTSSVGEKGFFPLYGFTLGKSTVSNFKNKGYIVKKTDSGAQHCSVRGVTFWDFDEDNVFEDVTMNADYIPDRWVDNLDIDGRYSYNRLLANFKKLGFTIQVKKAPVVKEYSGRKTLSADVTAISDNGRLKFNLKFDYGNDNGEGYTKDSSYTLYNISVESE